MKDLTAKFSFKVPDDSNHADAGKKVEKEFDYTECENDTEAQTVAAEKGWSLLSFVNEALKGNARGSAYQNALAVYKPSTVSPDEIKARMVRDFIRLGLSEEVAKTQVDSILSANNG
jgi:hypothetical protein